MSVFLETYERRVCGKSCSKAKLMALAMGELATKEIDPTGIRRISLGLRFGQVLGGFVSMAGIVDSHTHLHSFALKGILDPTLEAATEAGLRRLVTVGTDSDDWECYAGMAEKYPQVDYTVGIHPCSVDADWETRYSQIEAFWSRKQKPVALGEIGLDRFHLPRNDEAAAKEIFSLQVAACEAQLQLAKNLDAPVVIHSRGAFEECVSLIDGSGIDWTKVVFHCFSEGPGEMKQLLDRGGFGSFTGVITFKNAESVREAAKLQGLDRLMIETDAPYLAPMPKRGKPNEPAYLAYTAAFCAALFGVTPEVFAEKTTTRAKAFYGLG
ncbi:TatD family hydrolase [Pelagicoccus sp. SDUM812002]|uniref:TatD family hydrolase n=1 Tax=Pelagicoccus sp. SDUM812002 TaxID=3041266 RepID=UPI00280DF668|nr:TatD family hydrolase [Pelagicoccus sp. SDUM812002]MDQ8185690.1 TatD family hydrolase [Pelagicoccus sp. SDUM812002]